MGLFITLEGGDGSGKGTQAERLAASLRSEFDREVLKLSYPRYGEDSAYWAGQFLDGQYGGVDDIHPDLASLPYAIDRYAGSAALRDFLERPDGVAVSDRYVGSNLAHNGSKFLNKDARVAYYKRNMHLEYTILGIPKPDLNIVLLVDTATAQQNVDKKDARQYTTKTRDIHEADPNHLEAAKAAYQELCRLFPETYVAIDAMHAGIMRTREAIHGDILDLVTPLLNI